MIKKLTTFEIDEKMWAKFEEKRVKNINRKEKYASMNKSRILTGLVDDFVSGRIVIDLTTPEKDTNNMTQQAFHMPLETFVALEDKLNKEKAKYTEDMEKFQEVGKKKNVISKLIKYYLQK